MTERFIDKIAIFLSAESEPDAMSDFILEFCKQTWWVSADTQTNAAGQIIARFNFIELESMDLPGLLVLAHSTDRQCHAGLLGVDDLTEIPGVAFLQMAREKRFHLILADGEDIQTVTHEQLLLILQLLETEENHEVSDGPQVPAAPKACNEAIYTYCRDTPDIRACWIGLLRHTGQTLTLPTYLVLLDASNLSWHSAQIYELSHRYLPANQQLIMLEPMVPDHENHAKLLQSNPPFYSKKHGKGWLARLKRFFSPPAIALIQIEFPPGDRA